MGICCSRNELQNSEILDSSRIDNSDLLFNKSNYAQIYNESKLFDNHNFNTIVNLLISKFADNNKCPIKKITFVELWNISLMHKDNYSKSSYLIYDLRLHELQTENFIKKMNHINYSYVELKMLRNTKIEKFKKFIYNKYIIIIITDDKAEIVPNLISLFYEIDPYCKLHILNTSLKYNELSHHTKLLSNYIEERLYDILPFIIFTNSHLNYIKKEGFFFLNINNNLNLPKHDIINSDNENDNFIYRFINSFKISSFIHIYDYQIFDAKEYRFLYKQINKTNTINSIKDFYIGTNEKGDFGKNTENFNNMCYIIQKEMINGKSFIFDIDNIKNDKNDWLYIFIKIIKKVCNIGLNPIYEYLTNKAIFIEDIKSRLSNIMVNLQNDFL